jgi:hypothetical protein
MKSMDFKKVMSWLGFILRCPICGYKYNLANTDIIESEQNEALGEARILIHSDCGRCKSSVMFNIDVNGPEVWSAAMVTDLTSKDTTKFSHAEPISTDDLINIHTSIRAFNGDFVKAFKG